MPNPSNMSFSALESTSVVTMIRPLTEAMVSSGLLGFVVREVVMSCYYAAIRIGGLSLEVWYGQQWGTVHELYNLRPLQNDFGHGGLVIMFALHVRWVGSDDLTVCGATFNGLIIPKKPNVSMTHMARPSSPKLEHRVQSLVSKLGVIGRQFRGGLCIVKFTA